MHSPRYAKCYLHHHSHVARSSLYIQWTFAYLLRTLYNKHMSVTGGGVYIIQSPTGKYYVGLTRNFRSRFYNYQSIARNANTTAGSNKHWRHALQKYGWSAMRIGLLPCPENEMEEHEKLFIWLLQSSNPKFGYNKTSGGEISKSYTPEAIASMSAARRGKGTGKRGPCAASKQLWCNPDYRAKQCTGHKRLWCSPDYRAKIMLARKDALT